MNETPLIESERQPIWIIAAFIVALVAFLTSAVAIYRINVVTVGTQTEVLVLNSRIAQLKEQLAKAGAPAQAPAPIAPSAAPTK